MKRIASVILAAAIASGTAMASDREFYRDPMLSEAYPFSSAVIVGDTIYLSGAIGVDDERDELVEGGAGAETRQIFRHLERTLNAVGSDLTDIVKCTVFLDDMANYAEMNAAYAEAFPGPKPARSTFGVERLALGAALEIECLAIRKTEQ